MNCQKASQEANTLHVEFSYSHPVNTKIQETKSPAYVCGALSVMFACASSRCMTCDDSTTADYSIIVSIAFKKLLDGDDFIYECKIINTRSNKMKTLNIHGYEWQQIGLSYQCDMASNEVWTNTYHLTVECAIAEGQHSTFGPLYNDINSAEFKLCGKDGLVKIHRTILAAYSPVFHTMLEGEWKESKEGSVVLQGVSVETLQHLKDYMYLNRLPESGLQELCVLASYYMMQKLVVQCCAKLLNKMTTDNVIELSTFALRNKLEPLYIAILKTMGAEKSKIDKLASKAKWMENCRENKSAK